MLPLVR